jgi:hypothetical protein
LAVAKGSRSARVADSHTRRKDARNPAAVVIVCHAEKLPLPESPKPRHGVKRACQSRATGSRSPIQFFNLVYHMLNHIAYMQLIRRSRLAGIKVTIQQADL